MRFKKEEFEIIILDNGLNAITENDTNIITRIIDDTTNTVSTQRHRDFITGEYIYSLVDEGKEKDKIIGRYEKSIARSEALEMLRSMTEEEKKSYISKIMEEKKKAYERYKAEIEMKKAQKEKAKEDNNTLNSLRNKR